MNLEGKSVRVIPNDIRAMLGEGEDTEELFARIINGPGKAHLRVYAPFGTPLGDLVMLFRWYRQESYEANMSDDKYDELLEDLIREAVEITGKPEPSSEYVGYW